MSCSFALEFGQLVRFVLGNIDLVRGEDCKVKFAQEVPCSCGGTFPFSTYGEAPWPTVVCTKCGMVGGQINPLSVSVTAERLLFRSKQELEDGDYTLSIVIGTMVVESFLTRLFFKVKGMDNYAATFTWPTEAQEKACVNEYPRKGGFTGPADFVSKATAGMTFDEFVGSNATTKKIMAGFPNAAGLSPKQYFQSKLFYPRNRIAHWGYVNTSKGEAERCLALAIAIVSLFRAMDKVKYGAL
jgi:hypothetical protein